MLKKWWIIPAAIILLLIVLNPTVKDFKDYTGFSDYTSFRKTQNWLIFSIYETEWKSQRYLGICKNFIDITPKKEAIVYEPTIVDSTIRDNVSLDPVKPYVALNDPLGIFRNDTTDNGLPIFKDYIDVVYKSIKDKLAGFDKTPQQFRKLIATNSSYRSRAYKALKDNVKEFTLSENEFDNAISNAIIAELPNLNNKEHLIKKYKTLDGAIDSTELNK